MLRVGTEEPEDDVGANELTDLPDAAEDEVSGTEKAEESAAELTEEDGEEEPDETVPPENVTLLPDGVDEDEATGGAEEPDMEFAEPYSGRIFVRYAVETQPVPELNVILYQS